MEKTDLSKKHKSYYSAKPKPELLEFGPAQYLSLCGKGDPSEKMFAEKVQALYTVAYALKFVCKWEGNDFTVAKLEAHWWFDEKKFGGVSMSEAPRQVPRAEWEYRLLIRLPEFIKPQYIKDAKSDVLEKKELAFVKEIVRYKSAGGKAAQILHTGSFETEPASLLVLAEFMKANRLQKGGPHHEVYLSDFRKTSPEKLKTILREPVLVL